MGLKEDLSLMIKSSGLPHMTNGIFSHKFRARYGLHRTDRATRTAEVLSHQSQAETRDRMIYTQECLWGLAS